MNLGGAIDKKHKPSAIKVRLPSHFRHVYSLWSCLIFSSDRLFRLHFYHNNVSLDCMTAKAFSETTGLLRTGGGTLLLEEKEEAYI